MTFFKKNRWYVRLTLDTLCLGSGTNRLRFEPGERILCSEDNDHDLYMIHNGMPINTVFNYTEPNRYFKEITEFELYQYPICKSWIQQSNNTDYEIY